MDQDFDDQDFDDQDFNDQDFEEPQDLNPWFSIWMQPRATMQQILDTDPARMVLMLAIIAGFFEALDQAVIQDLGDRMASWQSVVFSCAIGGPLSGVFGLFVGGYLLQKTGSWLGGSASVREVRAAIAWGSIPMIWLGLLWIPNIALFGDECFTSLTPRLDEDPVLAYAMIFLGLIELIGGIWAIVISLKCLGQAHNFSAWRALGSILLAVLVLIGVFVVPFGLLFLMTR